MAAAAGCVVGKPASFAAGIVAGAEFCVADRLDASDGAAAPPADRSDHGLVPFPYVIRRMQLKSSGAH